MLLLSFRWGIVILFVPLPFSVSEKLLFSQSHELVLLVVFVCDDWFGHQILFEDDLFLLVLGGNGGGVGYPLEEWVFEESE